MGMIRTSLLALLLSAHALADDVTLRMGLGTVYSTDSALYSVGYEGETRSSPLIYRIDVGAWTSEVQGHHGSPFMSWAPGIRLGDPDKISVQASLGVSILGYTDDLLGGHFQFNECGSVTVWGFRIERCHWSSAGIYEPNHGRDYYLGSWVFSF